MSETGESSHEVGRVHPHPQADVDLDRAVFAAPRGRPSHIAQTLYLVICGGLVGALIGSAWGFGFAGFIGAALTTGAVRTGWLMFAAVPEPAPSGTARSEGDVRAALDEIEARKR